MHALRRRRTPCAGHRGSAGRGHVGSLYVGSLAALVRRPLSDRTLAGFVFYRLRYALVALVGLFVASTAGYVLIEHWSVLDAAFMTVITLSTVGYGVVRPLDAAGRVFTIGVIIASFATLVYAATMLTNVFTSGEAADHRHQARGRRMRHALSDHVIIIGFGRVGQAMAALKQSTRSLTTVS